MFRKKIETVSAIVLILSAIVLSGCGAAQSSSETAKNDNASRMPATAAAVNSNNTSANPPSAQTSVVNNNSAPAAVANKDRKTAPAVKEPTPQIGSGGDDMSLFTQARGALSSDKELASAVIIEIKEGNVTLNGAVSSAAQKAKAAQLVQGVKGIKSVKNNLRVS